MFASTLVVALVAVLGGVVLGPRLPGSAEPVLDLRELGRGDGPRTVVSPFVGIRSLLGDRSHQVMFSVQADAAAYWRLTSLEEYDPQREIWVSRGSYQRTDGELPPTMAPDVQGRALRQEYRIDGLTDGTTPHPVAIGDVAHPGVCIDTRMGTRDGRATVALRRGRWRQASAHWN